MNSAFGDVFLFLTDLAWKSRLTIPLLVTTAFMVMDIRLQIEINIQSGQVNATDLDDELIDADADNFDLNDDLDNLMEDNDIGSNDSVGFSSEYTIDDEDENGNIYDDYDTDSDVEEYNNIGRVIRALNLS